MPDISKKNDIEMADIAKINEQDVPSGGGGASEPTSGIIAMGGAAGSQNVISQPAVERVFSTVEFHSSVSSPPGVSDIQEIKGGKQQIGLLDNSGNFFMISPGAVSEIGNTYVYGGRRRQFGLVLTSVAEFSIGRSHTLAVKTDGTLWAVGINSDGQFGRGDTSSSYTNFVQIGSDTDWSKVSCGDSYSLALKTTGALYSAGKNQDGRTGQGTTSGDTTSWTQIGTDTDWTQISTGEKASAAIKGGTLVTWGDDSNNQLGLSSSGDQTSPGTANSDTDWQSVWVGANYIKAIKTSDGHHYHCGIGGGFGGGTRGDGSTSHTSTFTRIGTDTGWTQFIEIKYASFAYFAFGKKSGSWYAVGREDGSPYIRVNGVSTTSNTTSFVQLATPTPTHLGMAHPEGGRPVLIYGS